jgi:hypothetical protein
MGEIIYWFTVITIIVFLLVESNMRDDDNDYR